MNSLFIKIGVAEWVVVLTAVFIVTAMGTSFPSSDYVGVFLLIGLVLAVASTVSWGLALALDSRQYGMDSARAKATWFAALGDITLYLWALCAVLALITSVVAWQVR